MKKLSKIVPLLLLAGSMTACTSYSSKPGKIGNLVGTYELVTYTMKHELENGETEDYDHKAEIGAKAYFCISEDGYGYYGYKDNNTAPKVASMFGRFTYDEDKPNLVKAVDFNDGVTHKYEDEKRVGCFDEPVMGFRDGLFKKTLSYTIHSGHMLFQPERKIPYQYVEYKRISKDGSLAKINELIGANASFNKPFEMKSLEGLHVYRCQPRSDGNVRGIYEYAIIDFDSYADGKVTMYYSLAANPGQQTKQLTISVLEKGYSLKMEGLDKTFYAYGSGTGLPVGFSTKMEDYAESEPITSESFHREYIDISLEDLIDNERRPSYGPYVTRIKANGEKNYEVMSYDTDYANCYVNGVTLEENEEFTIFTSMGGYTKYFEDYEDLGTANGKVVEGTPVEVYEGEPAKHRFKVTEAGTYDISFNLQTTEGKVHITHA